LVLDTKYFLVVLSNFKMRAVLIRPPKTQGELEKSSVQHPINIAGIASFLRESGVDVRIWDFEVEKSDVKSVEERFAEYKPEFVGITCLSATLSGAKRIAGISKDVNPNAVVVLGGPHATAVPEETLNQCKEFDIIVLGEGEVSAREICKAIDEGKSFGDIHGIALREDGNVKLTQRNPPIRPLDILPHPARDLLNLSLYKGIPTFGLHRKGLKGTELFTSRGCPEECIFCSLPKVMGGKAIRFRSAENVLSEVRECKESFGFNHFTIEDDTFTLKRTRLEAICRGLRKAGVTYDCDTRVDSAGIEVFRLLKETGCLKVAMGVESGSPRILELIKKRITPEQVVDAFENSRKVGLVNQAFFIVGSHPSETLDDIKMSIKLLRKINPDFAVINVMTPFPGTELYGIMKEGGFLKDINYDKFDCLHGKPNWRIEHFTGDDLVRLQRKMYLSYVLNPKYILKTLKKCFSPDGFSYYFRSGLGFFRYLFTEGRI